MMLADEPGERILVPAPKRVEERRFLRAHDGVVRGQDPPGGILPRTHATPATGPVGDGVTDAVPPIPTNEGRG